MISRPHFAWTAGALLAVFLSPGLAPLWAADDYNPGDLIEVFFLNKWTPAIVIEVDKRGNVLAEFEFVRTTREVFKPPQVRAAYESGALLRGRLWTDSSGKFKTKAALLAVNDDETITIRKPDMTEVKMPLANLSDADKAFIKKLKKEVGLKVMTGPEPPPVEDFGGGGFGSYAVPFSAADPDQRPALSPDPLPSYLRLRQGGVAFGLDDDRDKLGAVLPLGGPDCWVLAALENENPWEKSLPTRVLWVSLTKQKLERKQLLPAGETVLDYHPPSRRLLTFTSLKADDEPRWNEGKPVLTLWETSPTEEKCKPIVRWNADGGEGVFHEPWARIIDGNTVLQRYKKQEYIAWDVSAKGIKYRIAQESFFAPLAVLSPGRRYLFLPEDNGVRVMEATTGNLLLGLPTKNGASGVAVSEDCRKAAVLEDFELVVWDLTDPQAPPERFEAQSIGTPFRADLAFVGSDRIMTDRGWGGGSTLFSMKTKIALWNYHYDGTAVHEDKGRRMRDVVDKHLVYAATVRSGSQRGLAVGAVQLPGPRVDEIEAVTTYDSLLIIKPGTPVKLVVSTGQYDAQVRKALEAEIQENGWILSENTSVVITATMGQSATQSVTYGSGIGFGRSQNSETVSVTPFYSRLEIKVGDVVAWQGGTSTGAPPVIWLREGQTAQGEVSKMQSPQPGFFDTVEIPDKIIDPAKRNGLGTTEVTNRGLIVK